VSSEGIQETIRKLREVELRPAEQGLDPTQVQDLLDEAADTLATAARKQTGLRQELERLQAANDESVIGKALLAATHAGEALLAEARQQATSLTSEAEAQAAALLEQVKAQAEKREQETKAAWEQVEQELTAAKQAHAKELETARADTEAALADTRRELDLLEHKAAQLRSLVADMERRIVETVRKALKDLEAFDATARRKTESDLLADLQPVPDGRGEDHQTDQVAPHTEDPRASDS
jgi:cell division septum initiation protein DivIVA